MSKRWAGSVAGLGAGCDLAGKYSSQLRALHAKCGEDPDFYLDALGYAADGFPDRQRECGGMNGAAILESTMQPPGGATEGPQSHVSAVRLSSILHTSPTNRHFEQHSHDELSAISTALMDQDFTQLDRVISFDDMSFTVPVGSGDATGLNGGNWNFGQ